MSDTFQLPMGALNESGEVLQEFSVVPMTAGLRKQLVSRENRKNTHKLVITILMKCITEIAGQKPTPTFLNKMVVGDLDYALMMIRKISMGDTISSRIVCGSCEDKLDADVSIENDVEIRKRVLDEDYTIEQDAERPELSVRVFEIEDIELERKATFRFPTGNDREKLTPMVAKNPIEANYHMYSRCLRKFHRAGELVPRPYGPKFVDDLSVPEIEWIEQEFRVAQPGPNTLISIDCEACGAENRVDMGNSDFLFKTRA